MPQFFDQDALLGSSNNPNIEPIPPRPKVLLLGGATEGVDTLSGFSEALTAEGIEVQSYDYTTTPAPERPNPTQKRYQEARVSEAIGEIDKFAGDDEKITLFGHSVGGPVAILAALSRADKVERVVLSNSTGLFDDSMPRLTTRFAAETLLRKNLTLTRLGRRQAWNGTKKIASGPGAFLGEALDGARTNILDVIAELRQRGVKVDVITSNADMVYPAKGVWETAQNLGEKGEANSLKSLPFDSLSSYFATKLKRGKPRTHRLAGKYAGHDQPIIYPEYAAKVVAQLVEQK